MSKHKINKTSIIAAAAEIADNEGAENISMNAISQKLGIRTPSLYNHIEGLDSLMVELVQYSMGKLVTDLREAVIGLFGDEAIRAICKSYLMFARKHPGLYESIQWVNVWKNENTAAYANKMYEWICRILEYYKLSDEYRTHAIRMVRSLLHGYASLEINNGFGSPVPVEKSFNISIDCLIENIKSFAHFKEGQK